MNAFADRRAGMLARELYEAIYGAGSWARLPSGSGMRGLYERRALGELARRDAAVLADRERSAQVAEDARGELAEESLANPAAIRAQPKPT